ncbi:SdrD B-like domain-containing protein [Nitrosopumilus oxyclinae]|uniref:SdrD B-like domain-containing protein n=1 Tax=Nitrosopumilus oxyclinae TaxID=1959104 RepID=UPI0015CBE85E|nr:SdrD B-like domain-containing protein [Nitrosopumilus oxyclinae]
MKNLIAIFALTVLFSTMGVQSAFAEHPILDVIASGETHTVTINETIFDLTIEQGGTLVVVPGVTLTIEGFVENYGTIQNNGIISITGFGGYVSFNEFGFPEITQVGIACPPEECGGGFGELINFGLIENNVGASILNENFFVNEVGGIVDNSGTLSTIGGAIPQSFNGFSFPPIYQTGGGFGNGVIDNFWLIHNRAGADILVDGSFYNDRVVNNEGTITVQNGFFNNFQGTIFSCSGTEIGPINGGVITEECFVFGEVHGFKWNDLNANGLQDIDEPVVSGIEVCLYSDNDRFGGGDFGIDGVVGTDMFGIQTAFAGEGFGFDPIDCILTNVDGEYWFTDLLPAFYYVAETLPDNLVQTFPNTEECFVFGEVPTFEVFGSTAHCVDLVEEPIQNDVNFGNILAASLHGQKLTDTTGDGVGDQPRAFVEIKACKITPTNLECSTDFNDPNTFRTYTMQDDPNTPVDETGMFWLNVLPGDYRVEERAPFGTSQILPPNGEPYFVTVASGDLVENLNFVNQDIPPGDIQGSKFQDANGNGLKDLGESGISGITFCLTPSNTCTQTNFNGDFFFNNIPAGQYSVNEILPFGSVNTTPLIVQVDVISDEIAIVPPFGNTAPVPANPEVTVGPLNSWGSGGLPSVYWQNNITVSKDTSFGFDHCGVGISPTAVTLQLEFTETTETIPVILVQDPTNPDVFTTVPALEPFFPRHGVLNLNFDVFCPDGTIEFQQGGSVYIDPSGQITDVCTDEPLAGAEVTLLKEFPPGTGLFVIAAESDYIQDTGSVQTTGSDGRYGWDTVPGVYKVSVSAPGFITQDSPEVPIPPPELELDLILDRVDACPVSGDALRELKGSTVTDLENINTDDKKATKEIAKAIKSINKSVADKLWEDSTTLTEKHGHKVFDEEKKAVKSLLKAAKSDSSIDVSGIIATLVEVDAQLAQNAINEAGVFAGDKKVDKELDKANKEMDKALEQLNKDKPDKAIDQYKKAWKHAQKALEKAQENDDDDSEEEDDEDEDEDEDDDEDD